MRTPRTHRSAAAIALIAAITLAAAGCGGDDVAETGPTTDPTVETTDAAPPPTGPRESDTPTTDPAETPTTDAVPAVVFLELDEQVAPVRRQLDDLTLGLFPATLEAWLEGPTAEEADAGYGTTVPAGTSLLSAIVDDGVARVDLSGEFASGGGSAAVRMRLAELTMTVSTALIVFDGMELLIDGEPVSTFTAEGIVIEGPLTVDDVEDHLPAIVQYSVLAGDEVGDGRQISGWANVLDGSVSVQVVDGSGTIIQDISTAVGCGADCRGRFTTWLDVGDYVGPATLRLFQVSADDGSELDAVSVPFAVIG